APDNADAHIALGSVYYRLGREADDPEISRQLLERARDTFQKVIEDHSQDRRTVIAALTELARVAIALRDDVLQANSYRRIIEIAPDTEEARAAERNLRSLNFTR